MADSELRRLAVGEPPAEGLRRLILAELDDVAQLKADSDDVAHDLRVAVKRIRAWLRLLRPALGEERYGYENLVFRNLSRPFTTMRERDVLQDTVEGLRGLDAQTRYDLNVAVATHVRPPDFDTEWKRVLDIIAAARQRFEAAHLPPDDVMAGLGRIYRRGRRAYRKARRLGSTVCLHEWRKQAKYLRYGLDVLAGSLPGADKARRRLKKLGDCLGEDHDLAQLCAVVGDEALPPPVLAMIEKRRRTLQGKAMKLGRRLYRRGMRRALDRFAPAG